MSPPTLWVWGRLMLWKAEEVKTLQSNRFEGTKNLGRKLTALPMPLIFNIYGGTASHEMKGGDQHLDELEFFRTDFAQFLMGIEIARKGTLG